MKGTACLLLVITLVFFAASVNASTYFYDNFNSNNIDRIKWRWDDGNRPTVSNSKLHLSANSGNPNQRLYFLYHPFTVEAEIVVNSAVTESGDSTAVQFYAMWFHDNNLSFTDKRIVCEFKIRANYVSGSTQLVFAYKIRSYSKVNSDWIIYHEKTGGNPVMGQSYILRMERNTQGVYFYVNDQLFDSFLYADYPGADFEEIGEVRHTDPLKRMVMIDVYALGGSAVSISSDINLVNTDLQPHPVVQNGTVFHVSNSSRILFDVNSRKEFISSNDNSVLTEIRGNYEKCSYQVPPVPASSEMCTVVKGVNEKITDFMQNISWLATGYIFGENACGNELLNHLENWAEQNALYNHEYGNCDADSPKQDWYQLKWLIGSASITYGIISNDSNLADYDKLLVKNWLKTIMLKQLSYSAGAYDGRNNHLYWQGLAAAAVGVMCEDDEIFSFGLKTFYRALDAMSQDGSFPLEMLRGEDAIHYQCFAIQPLVYIAEIANQQGYDLYGAERNGKNIHLAIKYLLDVIHDPTLLNQNPYHPPVEGQSYYEKSSGGKGWILSWIEPYYERFKDNEEIKALVQRLLDEEQLDRAQNIFRVHFGGGSTTAYFFTDDNGGGGSGGSGGSGGGCFLRELLLLD